MIGLLFWLSILLIVYIYAGYPLAVTILARLFPKPIITGDHKPSITMIIAAFNEESVIEEKLKNSLLLDYPEELLQILVADDGSDDQTVNIVKKFAGRVDLSCSNERRGKMAAIKRAIAFARGDVIVFSDANNFYNSNVLNLLVPPFTDPNVGAVSGAKLFKKGDTNIGETEGFYWRYESFIKKQESRFGSCSGVTGGILAIRRNLFVEPSKKIINDDFYILLQILRKGYRSVYEPAAISLEESSGSAKDEITRRTRIIAGRYQIIFMGFGLLPWKNPLTVWQIISHKFLRLLIPFFMIFVLFFNLCAVIWSKPSVDFGWLWLSQPFNYIFLILQIIFYLIALNGNLIKGKSPIKKIFYLPSYLVNSNYAAVIGLFRYITGRQQVTWEKVSRKKGDL